MLPSQPIATTAPLDWSRFATGRVGSVVSAAMAGVALYERGHALYRSWQSRHAYTVRILSDDALYADVQTWLLSKLPELDRRSLTAVSERGRTGDMVVVGGPGNAPSAPTGGNVRYEFNGRETVTFTLDGHKITAAIATVEQRASDEFRRAPSELILTTQTLAGQAAIKRALEGIAQRQALPVNPRMFVAAQWGGWGHSMTLPPRAPETVVLAPGQWDRLNTDLAQFTESEHLYARLGAPWHRGYLLSGPPGTGKTSTALALASAHRMDVYYLPLSDLKSDTKLIELIAQIRDRSVLLIEDIDVTRAATSREDGDQRLSAQGLLNALDGAVTPHGMVTIMTTNYPDALDGALLREGRCDVSETVGYLTDEQLARLVAVMTGRTGPLPSIGDRQIAASAIAEIVKRNITDMAAARAAIVRFLEQDESNPQAPVLLTARGG